MFADCFVFDQATLFNMCNVVCCATLLLLITIFEKYSTESNSFDYHDVSLLAYQYYSSVASPTPVGSTGVTKYSLYSLNSLNYSSGIELIELNQTCVMPTEFTQSLPISDNLTIINNYTHVDSNHLLCSTLEQNYSSASWGMYTGATPFAKSN